MRGGADSTDLISQCGVTLGGRLAQQPRSADTYNAISTGGDSVFFTVGAGGCEEQGRVGTGPDVEELFARVYEPTLCSEHDASSPCTIAISEPSKTDCATCDTHEAEQGSLSEEERDALAPVFQGATREGTIAYFLTKQKLIGGPAGLAPEGENLYRYDLAAPPGERLSLVAPEMASAFGAPGGVMRVPETGSRVFFVSQAQLATNRGPKAQTAVSGADNLYSYDGATGRYVFIATLSANNAEDWFAEDGRPVEATPEGNVLLFVSDSELTPDSADSGGGAQLYRYDAAAGELEAEDDGTVQASLARVSIGQSGAYACPATGKVEQGFNCTAGPFHSQPSPHRNTSSSSSHTLSSPR